MGQTSSRNKLWTESFIKICLVNFFIFVNFHALLPVFPFYIESIGGTAETIGLATALFSVASIVSRPFVGWLVDTKGRCLILALGLVGMALIPLGYFASAGVAMAVMLRTIHGAFHAASSNASSTWVTDIVPRMRMGEGLGMYGLSMALSTAIAPAMGLAVMAYWGFPSLFFITAFAAVVSLLLGVSIRPRNYELSSQPLRLHELFEKMSVPASVTQFFFMMGYGVIEVYVAIYADKYGLPGGGIYFIAIAVATVLCRVLMGRFIDRHGEGLLVITGNLAMIAGILLLVFLHNIPCYILSALLLGYSFGAVQPSLQTMAMHAVAPERRGAANSTFFIAFDLGIALGCYLAGMMIECWDYEVTFLLMALSGVCSLAYYGIFGRKHPSSFNPSARQRQQAPTMEPAPGEELPFVVTISREYGSGGRKIGEILAQKLGVRLYDKELIEMTARQSGLEEDLVEHNEQMDTGRMLYDDPVQTAVYHAQSRLIRSLASQAPCVIVGRLANFVLRDHPHCFSVFIYASEAYRMEHIISRYGVAPEDARETLADRDRKRREYCLHYTGWEWGSRHHYHMMIDSSLRGEEQTAQILYDIIKEQQGKRS